VVGMDNCRRRPGACQSMKKFLDTEQPLLYSAAPIVGL
jgi:hypothetical protein